MVRGALVATVAAVVLAPVASATSSSAFKLSVVPVPRSGLGGAAKSLELARDSGPVSNGLAASQANGVVTVGRVRKLGRVTGYLLDYGAPFGVGNGVHQMQTEVDQYRTAADAAAGLAFFGKDQLKIQGLRKLGLGISVRKLSLAGVGTAHWAYLGTIRIKGVPPVYTAIEASADGNYLVETSASAGTAAAAERVVPGLSRKLDARLHAALAGHLPGRPVKLLPPLRAGPPPHGPKPSAMVVQPTDLTGSAKVVHQAYTKNQDALSEYDQAMEPAGSFADLFQSVIVFASPVAATYYAAIFAGDLSSAESSSGSKAQVTPLDLSGVGDAATGELIQLDLKGTTIYEALIALTRGPSLDLVVVGSQAQISASDAQNLATTAASRLDSGSR